MRRYISYPKLPAGRYVFEAMASNNDGVWGDLRSITFVVKAAPWASWWAYALYVCLFVLALYLYYRNRLKNHKLENEIYLAACRKQDQEENHQARLLFFTNITHDFKTPLTMILGTIDSMEQDELNIPEGYMQALKSNSSRLLKLVNEVIDFRIVEKGMMSVKLTRGNLNDLVHSCASELREYAIKNSHSDFPVIWMGIFIWYVAYVNYGIKEMYCFNRQRVKSGTAWAAGIPTDGSPIILYQILVQ
ncbi:MAG: hypothetical protein BHV88_12075 [Clostridiales bacterium 41_12_two_minus]|nr:MAG: hypothetical protein BHV88_12075 [Clostridiales bacterium 41_12_two_minus]